MMRTTRMRAIRTHQCATTPSTKFSERGSLVPGLAARVLDELLLACTDKPSTFVEVDKDEAWCAAMQEMKSVEENGS
jgi:hypothetical protein